ncbi:alpha-(1,3)-fucosyltransferase 4-like [Nelusetta ayraudi]|uniref:alpha-(1,3)-fucosyltransferase 4-like n=1 Tax=Nelusetta ayraudi TaxID=303726 RepID=UPI003F71D2DF
MLPFPMGRTCVLTCVAVADFLLFLGVCLLYLDNDAFTPGLPPAARHDSDGDDAAVTLLVWVHPFGQKSRLPDCDKLYRIRGCTVTDDKSAYQVADAVIIHHRDVERLGVPLPQEPRPRAQKWIWLNHESPSNSGNLSLFDGVFNLTMSYRADSNIFLPYGYLVPRGHGREEGAALCAPPVSARLFRPYFLAWVVSNWSVSSARAAFYYELSRHVHVDVYGDVGEPLPRGEDSVIYKVRQYQFYLALENSQHTDYITEKLWNSLEAGAIPVVLGPPRENYERFLPPEAFIHVDDFSTVRGLAQYLLTLRRNTSLLRRHLDWRDSYCVQQPRFWAEHFCTACRAVRESRGRTAVVQDLSQWFQ